MSNFKENRKANNERKEREKASRENLGKFFYDLAKLTFAGIVVGGLTPLLSNTIRSVSWITIAFGIISTYIFAFLANRILKQ